jgi:hypothetical protein
LCTFFFHLLYYNMVKSFKTLHVQIAIPSNNPMVSAFCFCASLITETDLLA